MDTEVIAALQMTGSQSPVTFFMSRIKTVNTPEAQVAHFFLLKYFTLMLLSVTKNYMFHMLGKLQSLR